MTYSYTIFTDEDIRWAKSMQEALLDVDALTISDREYRYQTSKDS